MNKESDKLNLRTSDYFNKLAEQTLLEFHSMRTKYTSLAKNASTLIEALLKENNIKYLGVESRIKDDNSVIRKIKSKSYSHPIQEIMDYCGIRIILFLKSDVSKVSRVLEKNFDCDYENSDVLSSRLDLETVGYNSVHYICKIDENRKNLQEYNAISDLKFEVQIRTVLQHAWSEISRSTNYELESGLPREIERKLNLCPGNLELVDTLLSEITENMNIHKHKMSEMDLVDILNEEINKESLLRYFSLKNLDFIRELDESYLDIGHFTILSLRKLKIHLVKDLDEKIDEKLQTEVKAHFKEIGLSQFLRFLMMYVNIDKIFEFDRDLRFLFPETIRMLNNLLGKKKIEAIMTKYNIKKVDRRTKQGKRQQRYVNPIV